MEPRYPIINLSAAFKGKNARNNIASASYNSVPMERQHFLWGLNRLHSNDLHCIVSELSLKLSVFSICPCIQLHKYACNVSQIWPVFACSSSQYIRTCILLYNNVTFSSLSSRIAQLPNSYRDVGFKMLRYLIARGYDLFQKWMCLYSGFEPPHCANHLRCLVGFNEYMLGTSYCLE